MGHSNLVFKLLNHVGSKTDYYIPLEILKYSIMPLYIFCGILQGLRTKFANDGTQVWSPRLRFLVLAIESSGHVLWVKFLNYTKLSFSFSISK